MQCIKRLVCLTILYFLTNTTKAQTKPLNSTEGRNSHGIKWITGLSWEQVKEKAKKENRYIFVDCFTTWCGPCRMMDADVYPNDSVGDFFNPKFISLKVQMDQAKNDVEEVKRWYNDAELIFKQYHIEAYPTFLVFSPEGILVDKYAGAITNISAFIAKAEAALTPGKVFKDPYATYNALLADYKKGIIYYERIPEMVKIAKGQGDTITSRALVRIHEEHAALLKKQERYTKENISFWASLNLSPDRKIIKFFHRDGEIIDKVMNKRGFSADLVDKSIQTFIVTPFLWEQNKNPVTMSGMTLAGPNLPSYVDEADWEKLGKIIQDEVGTSYIIRNVLQAKITWYSRNRNWKAYAVTYFSKLEKFPPDLKSGKDIWDINKIGWTIFSNVHDRLILEQSIQWMEKFMTVNIPKPGYFLDTYANLLYKIGKTEEAIQWETKAIQKNPTDKDMLITLQQMKKGEPTYGVNRL